MDRKDMDAKTFDESFKKPALDYMEKYGYELIEETVFPEFTFIRTAGEEPCGYDGWQSIYDELKYIDELVENYSISELRDWLEGDFSKIPYGFASDSQIRSAIRYKENNAIADFSKQPDVAKETEDSGSKIEKKPWQPSARLRKNMDRGKFGYILKDKVDRLLYLHDIQADTILKEMSDDNGLRYTAILVRKKEESANISLIVNCDKYYDRYLNEEMNIEGAAQEVLENFETNTDKIVEINRSLLKGSIYDWEYIKDKISFVLLNRELNRQYLAMEDMANTFPEGMDDLCLVYKINLSEDIRLKVNNHLLEKWNISDKELYETAKKNSENIMQPSVKSMADIFIEIAGSEGAEFLKEYIPDKTEQEMYVITSRNKFNGAGAILLESVQKKLNELSQGREFFIIPSSKHEMLAIPDNGIITVNEIKDMVQEVNQTEVGYKDLLSNNVYKYNPAAMEIKTLTDEPVIEERQHRMNR